MSDLAYNSSLIMMIEAVLFDLDDTLLSNSIERFLPRYFALLGEYAEPKFGDRERFLRDLMVGTQAMIANTDRTKTNRAVFWEIFEAQTGQTAGEMEQFFDNFYETIFPKLRSACDHRPVAVEMATACFDRGLKVVIATNPVFPRKAVEHRLAWAGLPVDNFSFALVTSYENMHAAKPHEAYYREILQRIDTPAQRAIMIGDDWENDIVPAKAIGLKTYWIVNDGERSVVPEPDVADAHGTLDDCYQWLRRELDGGH